MANEVNVVEETKEVMENVAGNAVEVVGPIIEQKSSTTAKIVFGGVLITIATGVTLGIIKKVKNNKKVKEEQLPDDAFVDDLEYDETAEED